MELPDFWPAGWGVLVGVVKSQDKDIAHLLHHVDVLKQIAKPELRHTEAQIRTVSREELARVMAGGRFD